MITNPSHIVFASTYPPVVCGIGTYTASLVRNMPSDRVTVVAFDPDKYGAPVVPEHVPEERTRVIYALARPTIDPCDLMEAVKSIGCGDLGRTVLWIQYTEGIWPRLADLLKRMEDFPVYKAVSFHSVHFQSPETQWGLRLSEYRNLQEILPRLDCATVFTRGVRRAIQRAFPQHATRVMLLRHALEPGPTLTRDKTRRRLAGYLAQVRAAVRPLGSAQALLDALADPSCVFVGSFGFIQWDKGLQMAYMLRDALEEHLPTRRVVGLVMGSLREPRDRRNQDLLAQLEEAADGKDSFLVVAMPPDPVFRISFHAVDLNVFWPDSPTQSGRVAHAIGMGAVVLGRDIEGVGEDLREAGASVCRDFDELVGEAVRLLTANTRVAAAKARAQKYVTTYSWANQGKRHLQLADAVVEAGSRQPIGTPVGPCLN